MRYKCHWSFTQRKYWALTWWTEFELWIYEGSEFQTDEPEHTNVFRYISKWGFGVYTWKLDDDRNSLACISDAKVKDELRYSGASPLRVLNIWIAFIYITRSGNDIHLGSENSVDLGRKNHNQELDGQPFSEVSLVFPPGNVCNSPDNATKIKIRENIYFTKAFTILSWEI